ncbi:MAG: hypothetical protein E7119_04700 [Bacteroidales bacterium]|nr:hypothetical protein [Bacteroidales bacterium]
MNQNGELKNESHQPLLSLLPTIFVHITMFYATKDECTVAIVVVDNCCIDLGVYLVGDGVFEEICSLGVSAIENFSERLDQLPIVPSDIDKLIILSNKEIPQYEVKQIEESLNLKSEIRYNLDELMTFGSFIYRGVLCGWVRDILLLPVLPNSLYCETLQNEVFELIGANITIPTRKRVKVVTKSSQLYIKEKNHNHPIAILQLDNMFDAKKCDSLDFETDIDANFKIKITITGADKGNKYEVFI